MHAVQLNLGMLNGIKKAWSYTSQIRSPVSIWMNPSSQCHGIYPYFVVKPWLFPFANAATQTISITTSVRVLLLILKQAIL